MPVGAPAIATAIAAARSRDHEVSKSNFQVNGGTPVASAHDISLFPIGVTACRSQTDHSVIVGYFLPPVGTDFSDLPERVARSLDFALNTKLQALSLSPELQPSFESCDAAKPKTPRLGARYAKALKADAFVSGNIADGPAEFTVSTYVSDAHNLFGAPNIATSKSVNLNNPSGAAMVDDVHAAILAAIAAGLAEKKDCVSATTVLSAAEQLLNPIPPYIVNLRQRCEAELPNVGLLGTGP
jgi:hypothetical protein